MSEDSHESAAIHAVALVAIICCCLWSDFQIKKKQWYFLPESAASMIIGFVLGGLVVWASSDPREADLIKFDAMLFFFILLPPIVFEAGYTLDRQAFFSNIGSIMVYAVIGTSLSTIIVGYGLFLAASNGVIPLNSNNALEALMFGSLISATDPVRTFFFF
jgi:sodium/hydrogen exchanger 8